MSRPIEALIDADIVAYKACVVTEDTIKFSTGDVHTGSLDQCIENASNRITRIMEEVQPDLITMCLTGAGNFRKDLCPKYKANRKDLPRPKALGGVKEWMRANYPHRVIDGLEADDVIGIYATKPDPEYQPVIVSEDKDLDQIPGIHWNPGKPELGLYEVTPETGDFFHLMQTLTGDIVDGYPGCPGVGDVKALKYLNEHLAARWSERLIKRGPRKGQPEKNYWLEPCDDPWKIVVSHFERTGLTEDDALLQARLAKILQWGDYENGGVKLWTP